MLTTSPFYHGTIRKLIVAFGTLMNNISIQTVDENGSPRNIKVPITYAPKALWYARITGASSIDGKATQRMSLPRMGFEYSNLSYDASRHLNAKQKHRRENYERNTAWKSQWQRVPYQADFSLYIVAKREEESVRIVEQILPYFTPELNITINDNPDLGQTTDVPFVLKSVEREVDYENDYTNARTIMWTLGFSARFYFYKPTESTGLIRKAIVNLYDDTDVQKAKRIQRITVQPDPLTAGPTDDYTFLVTEEFFDDAKEYDLNTGVDVVEMSSSSSSTSTQSSMSSSSSSESSSSSTLASNTSSFSSSST